VVTLIQPPFTPLPVDATATRYGLTVAEVDLARRAVARGWDTVRGVQLAYRLPTPDAARDVCGLPRRGVCRQCRTRAAERDGAKLCGTCRRVPGVRERFGLPPVRDAGQDPGDFNGYLPAPAEPTRIAPGPAKVKVLAERYAAKTGLWHPADNTGEG
jgi:hypothetical protein